MKWFVVRQRQTIEAMPAALLREVFGGFAGCYNTNRAGYTEVCADVGCSQNDGFRHLDRKIGLIPPIHRNVVFGDSR